MSANSSSRLPPPPYLRREAIEQLPQIHDAVERVARSGRFLFGEELSGLERELTAAIGIEHAVGVGSGTDAIHLALRALDVGPGDGVITQSHSSPFTVIAIRLTGAQPILVESSDDDFGIDLGALERALRQGAKAVIPVHLYGHPVRIREIVEIAGATAVVEDCAQAQGATVEGRQVGTFGRLGCFSFYPTKNLGALGDGGAVVTRDAGLAERIRHLRNGGLVAPGVHAEQGITSRLIEVQAAVLRMRLRGLENTNAARRQHAVAYARDLHGINKPLQRAGCQWAPHQYVVRSREREALRAAAAEAGIALQVHYPQPIHLQVGFETSEYPAGSLPVAERLAAEVLSLPTHPAMTAAERTAIIDTINAAVTAAEEGRWKTATS